MSSIKFYLMNALTVFMVSTCSLTSVLADENIPPEVVVTNFQDGLINIMKSPTTLTTQQRYKKFEPIVDVSFHFPLMVRIAVGSYWGVSDEELRLKAEQFLI